MNRSAFKKISAAIITTAVLFTTVFSAAIISNAASTKFTPRLSAPDSSNKYYYDSDYNVFQKYGYGLPNCTAYAYGRAYEILGTEPKLSWNGAGQWYGYNMSGNYYDYGSTPKVGAIACWSYSGGGHVAVVEQIDSDGSMTLSNSEWGGRTFYLTTAKTTDSNPGGNSWWTFQGYIYLIDSPEVVVDDSSSYKKGIYEVEAEPYLNMRSKAGTGSSIVGSVKPGTKITVTETVYANGYNWGYTQANGAKGWVALEYCRFVSEKAAETTAAPTTTAPATTAPKTTTAPTTVAPTTVAPTTAAPKTTAATTVPRASVSPTPDSGSTDSVIIGSTGDVDGDGRISIQDATLIQKYLVNMVQLTKDQIRWSDFDFDGKVTINDVSCLQHYLSYNC